MSTTGTDCKRRECLSAPRRQQGTNNNQFPHIMEGVGVPRV
jgi:hypothetical protein